MRLLTVTVKGRLLMLRPGSLPYLHPLCQGRDSVIAHDIVIA